MIKVADIIKIVKLTIASGYLKNIKPLSLLMIGEVGIGKTEIITSIKSSKIKYITDLSYMGFLKILKENPKITHIIIPDFIKITHKKRATSDNLVSILNSGIEEGIGEIHLQNFDLNLKKGKKNIGIITSTTKNSYIQQRKNWSAMGFIDRFIICSYSYSDATINDIIKSINNEDYLKKAEKEEVKHKGKIEIKTKPTLNKKLNPLINKRFRKLKHLQAFVKCNALLRGSSIVENQDIKEISRLSKYLNLDFTPI